MTDKEIKQEKKWLRNKIKQELFKYCEEHQHVINCETENCFKCERNWLRDKLIEVCKQIENEKSENERLVKDGEYLTQQVNELNKQIEKKDKVIKNIIQEILKEKNKNKTAFLDSYFWIYKCGLNRAIKIIKKLNKE